MNVVRLCGSSTGPCGYCNGNRAFLLVEKDPEHCSKSYGLLVSKMSPFDYESLLQKGWRRSGIHLYKPDNWNSCCPALSIRLQTTRFTPLAAQERVVRKLERALLQGQTTTTTVQKKKKRMQDSVLVDSNVLDRLQTATLQCLQNILLAPEQHLVLRLLKNQPNLIRFKVKPNNNNKKKKIAENASSSSVTLVCSVCAALAGQSKGALQRNVLSRSLAAGLLQKSINHVQSIKAHEPSGQVLVTLDGDVIITHHVPTTKDNENNNKNDEMLSISTRRRNNNNPIQDWLETNAEPPYHLTITTVDAHKSSLQPDVHKLYFQYQQAVHGDPDPLSNVKREDEEEEDEDWGEASPEYIKQVKQMLQREYSVQDAQTMYAPFSHFYRFLVESPIDYDGTYGTVHQQYRINNKLVAIGVVDILPQGLSSVYAIYDPSQRITAFGKYLSLKEIQYASPLYYYLGYYIESCQKMRYKAEYKPSELLCPTTYKWVDAAEAQATLLRESPQHHVCTLYKENDTDTTKTMNGNKSSNGNVTSDALRISQNVVVNQLRLDVGASSLLTLSMLHAGGQAVVRPLLEEFVQEMGPELAPRFIIKLV